MSRASLLLALVLLPSCIAIREDAKPLVQTGAILASQYNFRGMVNNAKPVVQTDAAVSAPTKWENGEMTMRFFANWDISNDTGDSWFPDGHGGEVSEYDVALQYTEHYRGFDVSSGIESYALQNGDDFPFARERGETKEIFLSLGQPTVWDLYWNVRGHYDFDEAEAWYFNAAISREFQLPADISNNTSLSLGYMQSNQAEWIYGLDESGLADLHLRGEFTYQWDRATTLEATANVATILDSDLKDWFDDDIGVDSTNFWVTVGARWGWGQ